MEKTRKTQRIYLKRDTRFFLQGIWLLMKESWSIVLPFLILYSVINVIATSLLVKLFLRFSLVLSGNTYIGQDNLTAYLTAPTTILLLLPLCGTLAFLFAGFPATTIAPLRELIFVCVIAMLLFFAGLCGRKLLQK